MCLTRLVVCFLLAAQVAWAMPSQSPLLTWSDEGHDQQPADPSLGETEDASEEKLHSAELLICVGSDVGVCIAPVQQFARAHADQVTHLPERVILDLAASRAPPCVA